MYEQQACRNGVARAADGTQNVLEKEMQSPIYWGTFGTTQFCFKDHFLHFDCYHTVFCAA